MKPQRDDTGVAVVYSAVRMYRDTCLLQATSAFLPVDDDDRMLVWTPASTQELIERFIERPDEGKRGFTEKLRDQLSDASRMAVQLLVELTWLHLVISSGQKYDSKKRLLTEIAQIRDGALPHSVYDKALHVGLASTGTSFYVRRPNQLWLLVRFADRWVRASKEDQQRWLDDPWEFRRLVFDLEGASDQTQRHALIHLIHPEAFENTVSQYHKREMAELAKQDETGDNVDRTLANIRARLALSYGEQFSFYDEEVRKLWQPESAESEPEPDGSDDDEADTFVSDRSAWLIRGSGGERIPEWLEQGVCSIGFSDMFPFELHAGVSRDELRQLSVDAGVDTTAGGYNQELGQVYRFLNKVEVGDYIVTTSGQDVYIGVVDSPARDIMARTRKETYRRVEWLNGDEPIRRKDVGPAVYSKMRTLLTLSNITSVIDELERWAAGDRGRSADDEGAGSLDLPRAPQQLEVDLLLPRKWLDEVISLLEEKRQIVLYGPPGTGKTFLAQAIADHLTEDGGTTELVQFHPSYTYEDFLEGYRPVPAAGGNVSFEIKPGPLRRLAQTAALEPGSPHVLVVDEINRANLAKVFGELYFLLEYRDKVITLQYSDEEFTLPGNLFVIGTMNTADRSIALVDAAMRRRFYFVEMAPSAHPIDGLLAEWLKRRDMDDLPDRMLRRLNELLGDPDAAIGPSFLMSEAIRDQVHLERIWNHSIIPLLEERFYGTGEDLLRFSFDNVLAAVTAAQS